MAHESIDAHYASALRDADVGGLIMAARQFIDAKRLDDAQTALLAAGRIQPREGEIYRWLGEVLLRRGDATRAEKVLEKAMQFGSASAGPILDQARGLIPTQQAAGLGAVAELFAQFVERGRGPIDMTGPFHGSRRFMPPESDGEIETAIRRADQLQEQIRAALEDPTVHRVEDVTLDRPAPGSRRGGTAPLSGLTPMPDHPPHDPYQLKAPTRSLEFDIPGETGPLPDLGGAGAMTPGFDSERLQPPPSSGRMFQQPGPSSGRLYQQEGPPSHRMDPPRPVLIENLMREPLKLGGAPLPEPRDVLDALEAAGIYERDNTAVPQVFPWMKPEPLYKSKKGAALLISLGVLLVVGGVTTFVMVTNARARDHVICEQMLAQVDKDLDQGDAKLLDPAEKQIAHAFDLDSRSPHAALTWLHERVSLGLLKGGQDIAFEDATARAKEVGIDEKKIAFANIAAFLFQGDTAGAASAVAKWDQGSADDPWFQLLAGATFERAGDPRALERYANAVRLAPGLVTAQILLNRAMAVDGDPHRAVELAKEIRIRQPDRLESAALVLLAWARDPNRGEPPAEAKDVLEKADSLPPALRSVPYAARAILAIPKGMFDDARTSLQKGLALADTPGMATWLGSIALVTGDEELARKAALAALSFSAAYPPARVLAARVALFAARLDEALKATEDLPPSSADVAIVSAAAAYEKLDSEHMSRALDALSDESKKSPYVGALVHGQTLMAGGLNVLTEAKALDSADDEAPWADLVAIDWALDTGDIELAKKIASAWRGEPRAMRAVRLARLARYDGRIEDAEKFSKMGLESGTPTIRALAERVFTLVAAKKDTEALAVFKTFPNVGGTLAKWLRAYATAMHNKEAEAKAMIANEDPPSNATPLEAREIAVMTYGATKDTRHGADYAKSVIQTGALNPDMAWAADRLNLPKLPDRAKKK
jgi:tetratricopeptide (TPR) repeat protein